MMFVRLLAYIRQLWYPRALRIRPLCTDRDMRELLLEIAALLRKEHRQYRDQLQLRSVFLADLATQLWRVRSKLKPDFVTDASGALVRARRQMEWLWDTLLSAGFSVSDHTGEVYHSGTTMKVLAFQPTDGLEREVVIETISPTIYFQERLLQLGEVIVGVSPQ